MPSTLPAELLAQILADDRLTHADLAACCLASRSTLHIARPHLYARTHLRYGETAKASSRQTQGWLSTVQANPHLASLVRCLKLSVMVVGLMSIVDHDAREDHLQRMAESIVAPCHNLLHLDIGTSIVDPPVRFPFANSLLSLGIIRLDSFNYELLLLLPQLKHLWVGSSRYEAPVQVDPAQPPPSFQLETLIFHFDFVAISQAVVSAIVHNSTASLRMLELNCTQSGQWVPRLPGLDTLSVRNATDDVFQAALRASPALRTLHVADDPVPGGISSFAYLGGLFSAAPLAPSVRRLELPRVPGVDDLDALLQTLAPLGVHLSVLGVVLPYDAWLTMQPIAHPNFRSSRSEHNMVRARAQWDEASARRTALEPFCAARGITLVESRATTRPGVAWVRE
ncbi:hypothetical protein JCM10449v2_007141 [Rhodotorula kratochvilovae]